MDTISPMPGALDPRMREILDASPPLSSLATAEMRRHALLSKQRWNDKARAGLRVIEEMTGSAHDLPTLRCEAPDATGTPIVHLHGGGWSIGSPQTHLSLLADLAGALARPVLAPHPRQAPEHPYPAPLDDVLAALSDSAGGPLVVSGDSAGANLALAAALKARDDGRALPISALILFYGCYRRKQDTASHAAFGTDHGLTSEKMARFWDGYAPEGGAYADLSEADFTGLPPVQLHIAECDPLADDSRWLAVRLRADGVHAELHEWTGMAHGFLHYASALPQARDAFAAVARFVGDTE